MPIHSVLPFGLFAVARLGSVEVAGQALLWGHVAAALGFVVTVRWWWPRAGAVVSLVALNHVATALGAVALAAMLE